EDPGRHRLFLQIDQHDCILVETHVRAVLAAHGLAGTHQDRADDVLFLDAFAGFGRLDRSHDYVADFGITVAGAPENAEAADDLGAAVVGHFQYGTFLDHSLGSRLWGVGSSGVGNGPARGG